MGSNATSADYSCLHLCPPQRATSIKAIICKVLKAASGTFYSLCLCFISQFTWVPTVKESTFNTKILNPRKHFYNSSILHLFIPKIQTLPSWRKDKCRLNPRLAERFIEGQGTDVTNETLTWLLSLSGPSEPVPSPTYTAGMTWVWHLSPLHQSSVHCAGFVWQSLQEPVFHELAGLRSVTPAFLNL